jgi:hypothetical protein
MPLLQQTFMVAPRTFGVCHCYLTVPENPVTDAKTERLVIRISPADKKLVERAAAADDLEVSTWARRIIVQAARRRDAKGKDATES